MIIGKIWQIAKTTLLIFMLAGLVACANKSKHAQDPLEPMNRGIYQFNKGMDNLYILPITRTYNKLIPLPAKKSAGNFIQNINEVPTFINDILQGKPKKAGKAILRLAINSTLGILGLFDVASEMGVESHRESLANTFVHWGYENSTYLVLPFIGPNTIRDTVGLVGNTFMTPSYYFPDRARDKYYALTYVHKRDEFLDVQEVIDAAASVDEYAFVRDAYFQKTRKRVRNRR